MSFEPRELLRHILTEVEFLVAQTDGRSKSDVIDDEVLRRAIVRSIEVIGEATKQIPIDFRTRYSQIPWRTMAGMRDRLIHGYFGIDYDIVWGVAAKESLTLKREIEQIMIAEGPQI